MEAKNRYFKETAHQGNFKNVALSVARRHQKLMCGLLNSDDFFDKSVVTSTGTLCKYNRICINYFLVLEKSTNALSQESDWVKESLANHLPTVNDGETTVVR